MNNTLLLVLGAGAVLYLVTRPKVSTVNPVVAAAGPVYVPPQQAVPTVGGWASPSAPGAAGWGLIPPQPTDAQQASQVIGSIGTLAGGLFGSGGIQSLWNNSDNS